MAIMMIVVATDVVVTDVVAIGMTTGGMIIEIMTVVMDIDVPDDIVQVIVTASPKGAFASAGALFF